MIRELIDREAPISLDEIIHRSPFGAPLQTQRERSSRRWLLVTSLAVLVVVIGTTVLVTQSRNDGGDSVQATGRRSDNSCVISSATEHGCARSPRRAQRELGIAILTPELLPDGWALVRREIRQIPGNDGLTAEYTQTWAPNGELGPNRSAPQGILIIRARPVDDLQPTGQCEPVIEQMAIAVDVCGHITTESTGDSLDTFAHLEWRSGATTYSVTSAGLTRDEILLVLGSLRGG